MFCLYELCFEGPFELTTDPVPTLEQSGEERKKSEKTVPNRISPSRVRPSKREDARELARELNTARSWLEATPGERVREGYPTGMIN